MPILDKFEILDGKTFRGHAHSTYTQGGLNAYASLHGEGGIHIGEYVRSVNIYFYNISDVTENSNCDINEILRAITFPKK